jgi:hypothetical protein
MIKECTEERYDEMLGILPPAMMSSNGFLVGEPFDHRVCKVTGNISPTFAAFFQKGETYYEGDNMTIAEFRAFNVADIP